jgi:type IV secretion system protein VirB10
MINSVSTKQAQVGDRIYLETAFPVLTGNRIVVPQGSWVTGTVTLVQRPGRVKGRGELEVRFDSLTLPNGVTRNFRSDLGALDGRSGEDLNREQSKVKGPTDKTGDANTVITTTAIGAGTGALAGSVAGHPVGGGLIGLGAGAAAGMAAVMLTRGPDATLSKGSSVEMVLDRSLTFQRDELDFSGAPPRATLTEGSQTAPAQRKTLGLPFPL